MRLVEDTQVITNDQNVLQDSVLCPISCGECCDIWYTIPELAHLVARTTVKKSCPYYRTNQGCRIKRARRPIACNGYVCELAILALLEQVSQSEINEVLAQKKQFQAFSTIRKPLVISIKREDVIVPAPIVETIDRARLTAPAMSQIWMSAGQSRPIRALDAPPSCVTRWDEV